MTVAQLIVALQALPPDLQVIIPSNQTADFVSPVEPILDTVMPAPGTAWQLCDYDDDGVVTVVRLLGLDEVDDRAARPKPPHH